MALPIVTTLAGVSTAGAEDCWRRASEKYGVPVKLIQAIANVESEYNPHAVNQNHNRSYDLGLMQVNSRWLSSLKEHGIRAEDLYDPCTNIDVGAWILAQEIRRHGYTWKAVGYYNANDPAKQHVYITRVAKALEKIP